MIAVIADDLTGAAELGGIGLSYGLTVEISMSVKGQTQADLLVVATDARSVSEPEAVREMVKVSAALHALKPQLIYKKTDSVLRGHVMAETLAQLVVLGLTRALLVPANPSMGRTLVNGHYFVDGELIHRTSFASDPEFPVTDSSILNRFKALNESLVVQSYAKPLPEKGLVVGEVEKPADLRFWAKRMDNHTLPGGGSGFFTALLESLHLSKRTNIGPFVLGERRLYVCGSSHRHSQDWVGKAVKTGSAVHYIPKEVMCPATTNEQTLDTWAAEVAGSIRLRHGAILAIAPDAGEKPDTVHLRTVTAHLIRMVLDRISVDELLLEGGSTASAVLRAIGVTRLVPTHELAPGVVRNAAPEKAGLHITLKPGSYPWPRN